MLAAGAPEHAPFMADEAMLAIPGLQPLDYTLKHYMNYATHIKACLKKLNAKGEFWSGTFGQAFPEKLAFRQAQKFHEIFYFFEPT